MIVNGRYVHAEPGGFRRYAEEVSSRLVGARVCAPPASLARGATGKVWEQTVLGRIARGDTLWSPATSGPVRHRDHVVTVHDLAPLVRPESVSGAFAAVQRRLIPALASSARAIVVDSAQVATELVDHLGVSAGRITIAEPGVGDTFRDAATLDRITARADLGLDRVDSLTIGGLVSSIPRKNSAALLDVLEAVTEATGAQAVVAGWDGPGRVFGSVERSRSQRVLDLGPLSDIDLARFYRALDVFVWLPTYEGFGLPVVEAAAIATPVVCSPVPAAREHLGRHVQMATTVADATAATIELLSQPTQRSEQGEASRAAVDHLTWERTADIIQHVAEGARV